MTTPYTEEDVEAVAKWLYFYFVDRLGYPNGMRTWTELPDDCIEKFHAFDNARAALDILIQRGWRKGE